jgi:sRNA-binding carbon storage regulator CsrA
MTPLKTWSFKLQKFKGGLSIKISGGKQQLISIGDDILLMVKAGVQTRYAQLIFQAPREVKILRIKKEEVLEEDSIGNK